MNAACVGPELRAPEGETPATVLPAGLKLLAGGADRDEIVRVLTATTDQAQRRQGRVCETAIAGLAAIADGKGPRKVGEPLGMV
jgi:hypothetical protein